MIFSLLSELLDCLCLGFFGINFILSTRWRNLPMHPTPEPGWDVATALLGVARDVVVAGLGASLGHCPMLWAGSRGSWALLSWVWDQPQPLDAERSQGQAQAVTSCSFWDAVDKLLLLGHGPKLPGRLSAQAQVQQGGPLSALTEPALVQQEPFGAGLC